MNNKLFLIIGAAALLACACGKEDKHPDGREWILPGEDTAAQTATVTVTLPRISVLETKGGVSVGEDGSLLPAPGRLEDLLVAGETSSTFTVHRRLGDLVAEYQGEVPAGERFSLVYPASLQREEFLSRSFTECTQQGNGGTEHLRYEALLDGVDSWRDPFFENGWASAHGGRCYSTACLRVHLHLPASVSSVRKVTLKADGPVFWQSLTGDARSEELSVNLENASADAQNGLVVYIPIPARSISFSAGSRIRVLVEESEEATIRKDFTFATGQEWRGDRVNALALSAENWTRAGGAGSEEDPYLIRTTDDMLAIKSLLVLNAVTCFRLANDIDMGAVTSWTPVNTQNAAYGIRFDGDGHTLRNFKCSSATYPSLFGVLHGEVLNLHIENATIACTGNSPTGTVCGWAGNSSGTLKAVLKNVHVSGGTVTQAGAAANTGGLCGSARNAEFTDCSFAGSVTRNNGTEDSYCPVGGLIGSTLDDVTATRCHTSGSVTSKNGRGTAGLVGYWTKPGDITGCSSAMDVTAGNDCTGGLVGWYYGGTVTGCTGSGTIKSGYRKESSKNSYCAGILGHSSEFVTMDSCVFRGTITAAGGTVAGVIGQANKGGVISRCGFEGELSAGFNLVGGVVSTCAATYTLSVSDCWSSGSISCTGVSYYVGGIIGDVPENGTVTRCWSDASVTGPYCVGGIAAKANGRKGSTVSLDTHYDTTISDCIAWNPSVKTNISGGYDPSNKYSGGCVVGCTASKNNLRNCWRLPTMTLSVHTDSKLDVAFDQEDADADHALVEHYADPTAYKYFFPYYGKAAGAAETLSDVARRLGWSETVWDLSGPKPVLR